MLSYTSIITPAQVGRADVGRSLGDHIQTGIEAGSGDAYDAVADQCEDITALVEEHLGRALIVRAQTLRFDASAWKARAGYEADDEDRLIGAFAREWPVLQVTSVDGEADKAAALAIHDWRGAPGRYLAYDPDTTVLDDHPHVVDCLAGYRRADQGLGDPGSGDDWEHDLTAEDGLSGLTELPPVLPRLIRRVALRIALGRLQVAAAGLVGLGRTSRRADQMTIEFQQPDLGLERRELARLTPHRYVGA